MRVFRDCIIKLCGGYTPKEHKRQLNQQQRLLDSLTTSNHAKLCNIYMCRMLRVLDLYAQQLYGSEYWKPKVYNIIHNNWFNIKVDYVDKNSSIIYKLDTTLDDRDEFVESMKEKYTEDIEDYADTILEND